MRSGRFLAVLVSVFAGACAGEAPSGGGPDDAAPETDALVGNTGNTGHGGGGRSGNGSGGAGGAAAIPLPGPPCTPGVALGLCQICTEAGTPALPADDPACPPVDCTAFDAFERTQNGGAGASDAVLCHRVPRLARADVGRCTGPGQCLAAGTAELCAEPGEPVELARVDPACGSLVGCAGAEPPSVTPQPEGTPCNGTGTCLADGTCSLSSTCARFPGQRFCLEEQVEGDIQCEYYVATPDGTRTTCTAFCEAAGGCCVDAWPEAAAGSCEHSGNSNCIDEHSDLVCRCTLRHEEDQTCPDGGAFEL